MLAEENTSEDDIIRHEAAVRLFIVSESGRSALLSVIFTTTDDDGRPRRTTMSPMWSGSGKSAPVEAAMKNMLAAATQQILDQWDPYDEEDEERKERSQVELDE